MEIDIFDAVNELNDKEVGSFQTVIKGLPSKKEKGNAETFWLCIPNVELG